MSFSLLVALLTMPPSLRADDVLLTAGPVEVLVTPTGVEKVLMRDRHVLGDPRPDRGTAIGWRRTFGFTRCLTAHPHPDGFEHRSKLLGVHTELFDLRQEGAVDFDE